MSLNVGNFGVGDPKIYFGSIINSTTEKKTNIFSKIVRVFEFFGWTEMLRTHESQSSQQVLFSLTFLQRK